MFKFIYRFISYKVLLIIITIVIASCSVNDKDAFNIIDEAKRILLNLPEKKDAEVFQKKEEEIVKIESTKNALSEKEIINKYPKKINIQKNKSLKETEIKKNVSKLIERNEPQKVKKKETILLDSEVDKKKKDSQRDYNIGVLLPLSGKDRELGALILNSLEMALFQINNKKINLIVRDTKGDPLETRKVFQEMVKENISLFIGPLYSKSLVSIEGYARAKNINIFALTNNINLAKNGIWVFGIDPRQQVKKVIDFLISNGNKKIGFLFPQNSYGNILYETVLSSLNRYGLAPERVEFFNDNIQSQQAAAKKLAIGFEKFAQNIKEIENNISEDPDSYDVNNNFTKEKPLDSVFIGASGQTLTILASQLQYSGVEPEYVTYIGTSSWEDNSILQEPALNQGVFSATMDFLREDISKTYIKAYDTDMPKVGMIAYDILSLLSIVLEEDNEINMQYLLNVNGFVGLRGLFRLKTDGTVERVFQIKKIQKEKFITFIEAPVNFLVDLN